MKTYIKNNTIIGFALFAMFFGAGNLIFPTYVGLLSGNQWESAMFGFLTTGVGLPLLGIFAIVKIRPSFLYYYSFSVNLLKFCNMHYSTLIFYLKLCYLYVQIIRDQPLLDSPRISMSLCVNFSSTNSLFDKYKLGSISSSSNSIGSPI